MGDERIECLRWYLLHRLGTSIALIALAALNECSYTFKVSAGVAFLRLDGHLYLQIIRRVHPYKLITGTPH